MHSNIGAPKLVTKNATKQAKQICSLGADGRNEQRKADEGERKGGGAMAGSGRGLGESVAALRGEGVLRHRHGAPALWLRSEV